MGYESRRVEVLGPFTVSWDDPGMAFDAQIGELVAVLDPGMVVLSTFVVATENWLVNNTSISVNLNAVENADGPSLLSQWSVTVAAEVTSTDEDDETTVAARLALQVGGSTVSPAVIEAPTEVRAQLHSSDPHVQGQAEVRLIVITPEA